MSVGYPLCCIALATRVVSCCHQNDLAFLGLRLVDNSSHVTANDGCQSFEVSPPVWIEEAGQAFAACCERLTHVLL
jgi:hypothetical protein